jgi:hypothetical protein
MSDERILTLRQADQARTDFALIESNLEFIADRLSRLPTRGDLAKAALGITMSRDRAWGEPMNITLDAAVDASGRR